MSRRATRRLVALALLVVAAFAIEAVPAWASESKLVYKSCVSAGWRKSGCPRPVRASLNYGEDVAVSPNGKSVYAVSNLAVTTFKRRSSGALVYKDCVAYTDRVGCPHPPIPALNGGMSIGISPDGHSVYVSGSREGARENTNAVVRFTRDRRGRLTFGSCIASSSRDDCGAIDATLPDYPTLAVSPDNRSIYVGGETSIHWFSPSGASGLEFGGCIKDPAKDQSHECATARHRSLHNVYDLVVSADGKTLYASSSIKFGDVAWFNRHRNGDISGGGCLAQFGDYGCRRPTHDTLYWPEGLGMSPSGKSLYVGVSGGVTRFKRDQRGRLHFSGCIEGLVGGGCPGPSYKPLGSVQFLAVDPTSGSIYAADGGRTISYLKPTHGGLRFVNCVSAVRSACAKGPPALRENVGITASPKGGSVYVNAWSGQSVSWLKEKR